MVDKYTPKRTKNRQKYPTWVSNETSHVLNKRQVLDEVNERNLLRFRAK